MWHILRMDKCMLWCIYFTRVASCHACFCFCTHMSHACDIRVPFKLWVICTIELCGFAKKSILVYDHSMLNNTVISSTGICVCMHVK